VYKIVYVADHKSDLAEAKQLYADQCVFCESTLDCLTDGLVNGELISGDLIRAPESTPFCDHLGCTLADTIGLGDSDNDLTDNRCGSASVCVWSMAPYPCGSGAIALLPRSTRTALQGISWRLV
jgi:hypothetical protein